MELFLFLVSLLTIAIMATLLKQLWSYYRMCKMAKAIPGPPTHWLYGNIHQLTQDEAGIKYSLGQMRNCGSVIWRAWFSSFSLLVYVVDPQVVQSLFNLKLRKSKPIYSLLEPWLGKGLVTADGSQWARNRHLLTNAFHFNILKPYVAVYNECSNILISKWSIAASQGEPVLVYKSIQQLTLDIILRCSFSYNSHCQESGKSDPYTNAVEYLTQCTSDRFHSPLMHISRSLYMYCTPAGWKYRRALNTVHRFAEKVIKDRKAALGVSNFHLNHDLKKLKTAAGNKYLNFLDILITAHDDDGTGLTDLEVRNEADTFLVAGHDSTANALTWALYSLAKYPEHQEKCREEINQVLEGRKELEYEDLSKLTYTTWCIKETLRLYPPGMVVFREIQEDTDIGNYLVPKEAIIVCHILSIHRNPKYWEDPDTFNPLRFHPNNAKHRHPYAYIPFSAGHRNCIGQSFALNEAKVIVASILHKFRLSLVEGHKVEMKFQSLLTNENDVKLWLERII